MDKKDLAREKYIISVLNYLHGGSRICYEIEYIALGAFRCKRFIIFSGA